MKRLIIILVLTVASFVGEVMCISKAISCNWKPVGKAEVIYTAGAFTGLGAVIGYIDIEDQ